MHRVIFSDEMVRLLPDDTGDGLASIRKRRIEIEDLGEGKVKAAERSMVVWAVDAVIGCDRAKWRMRQMLLKKMGCCLSIQLLSQ